MYTTNIHEIESNVKLECKFASVMYNRMLTKRYGMKPCKSCGDNDLLGGFNIHILKKELYDLSSIQDYSLEPSYETIVNYAEINEGAFDDSFTNKDYITFKLK